MYGLDSTVTVSHGNGQYDYFYYPILPGTSLGGFDVTFTYLGSGTPGPQNFIVKDFESEDPDAYLFRGITQPLAVPEPLSAFMMGFGLLGLAVARRKD